MKVVIAIDSFKGSLSSLEAGNAIKDGIEEFCKDVDVIAVADGGEGSVEAMMSGVGASRCEALVSDPLRRPLKAMYAKTDTLAIMEMASTSGLTLLKKGERNPLLTDTYGLGEMVRKALNFGIREFVVGIGGSATNDAGTGMLEALGYKFYDKNGNLLKANGGNLAKISRIDDSKAMPSLKEAKFSIACDVVNPLYGENGAAYIYGPQKGATIEMVEELDAGLRNFAKVTSELLGVDNSGLAGSGAAGGLGFGFVSFLGAELKSGFKVVSETINLKERLKGADLVITGEGRLDHQSIMGKTPSEVAKLAKQNGSLVVAFGGSVTKEAVTLNSVVDAYFCIIREPLTLDEAMSSDVAKANLKSLARQVIMLIKACKKV